MNNDEILIVGAGVGGLTAGIALEQSGFDVRVFERAESLRAEGAGISLFQNALRCLDRLGLADEVIDAGAEMLEGGVFDQNGRRIMDGSSTAAAHASSFPMAVATHRARLVDILADALESRITFDATVVGAGQNESSARIELDDGSEASGRLVIGADGLHSTVRAEVLGDENTDLRYAGYTSWRGVTDLSDADLDMSRSGEYWGSGQRFGIVPIGHGEVYWFAVGNAEQNQDFGRPTRELLVEMYADWPEQIPALIESTTDEIIRTDIRDREPSETWGRGRLSLLGDAIHPMTPDMGQGGCQAIEDGVVLADALANRPDDLVAGLRNYEDRRRGRTRWVVEQSRKTGRVAQWKNWFATSLRNVGMRLMPQSLLDRQLERVLSPDFLEGEL